MSTHDLSELGDFYGTQQYHYLNPKVLLTDGAMYLAVNGQCFWLMDAIASHLLTMKTHNPFTQASLTVKDNQADLVITDGNGNQIAKQHFEYTDFPLASIDLYCVYENDIWIFLLTTEY